VERFLRVLRSGESDTVLQWPSGQRSAALIHPLAMLAMLCAPPPRTGNLIVWCAPVKDFRTLYFPWRSSIAAVESKILVDRNELVKRNSYHLTRRAVNEPEASEEMCRLHETLGHLQNLRDRDERKPHLAHPTLAEMYPAFVAGDSELGGAFRETIGELFGRIQHGAGLDQLADYRGILSRPRLAPFALFGVAANADVGRALASPALSAESGRPPDVCVIDLGPAALNRLGHDWEEQVGHFVTAIRERFDRLPVMTVTQDVYAYGRVQRVLRATVGKERRAGRDDAGCRGSVILCRGSDPLASEAAIERLCPIRVQVHCVAGIGTEAMTCLSEAARKVRDPTVAGSLRHGMGSLRRALSLPCGLSAAYAIMSEEQSQDIAEDFLESRARASVLGPIHTGLASGAGGGERESLLAAESAVQRAFDTLENETPIGSLVQDLAEQLARKSSRSVLCFASEVECRLAERRLTGKGDGGRAIERHVRSGHMALVSAGQMEQRLASIEASRERRSWKRLVLVAPLLDQLSGVLTRSWLPEDLVIACERTFALRMDAVYRPLASEPNLIGEGFVGDRLAKVAMAARREAEARGVAPIELDLEPYAAVADAEDVIDLTGDSEEDGRELVVLRLESGRRLRARPGSVVIRYRHQAEINAFERAVARQIRQGETIVVPDRAFVEEARRILPVRVLAQNWVEVFHTSLEDALPQIPGATLSAKARHVLEQIQARGAKTMSQGAVLDWLRVEERRGTPREQLRPHAPGARREFDALMAVINVPETIAARIWAEGIQPLRIDRRRAGLRMAQAFVSVLVDQHAAASALDASVRERIGTLCAQALEYLDVVSECERRDDREAGVE
jgi:hypothetical protein